MFYIHSYPFQPAEPSSYDSSVQEPVYSLADLVFIQKMEYGIPSQDSDQIAAFSKVWDPESLSDILHSFWNNPVPVTYIAAFTAGVHDLSHGPDQILAYA